MKNENEDKLEQRLVEFEGEVSGKDEKEKKKSQADKLVEIAEMDCRLFHDQFGDPYAQILVDGHLETWKVKSKHYKRWLCERMWEAEEKAPHSNALSSALNIIESKACFKGDTIQLENRVAEREEVIYCDLTNKKWQAVEITKTGWKVVDEPPILFRRYSHQQPQIHPAEQGDIKKLLKFINLQKKEQELLLLVYLVSCFIPDIPHPIPILYGPQGAAKTTTARMLRALIDPSSVGVLSMPSSINDLVQQLSHNYFAFFDNVTYLPDWSSDAFCRAVTGEGFFKRELYSDDEDIIYHFRRCIGLNGINLAAKKPDLLDRAILFKLDRITHEKRRGERDVWKEFEAVRPVILGGIFSALSKAMAIRADIELERLPRMADFTLWGCAIAEALGYSKDEFLNAYMDNIGEQHDEAILESPVASMVMVLMEASDEWEGSPSDLLEVLTTKAEEEKLTTKGRSWPKAPAILSRRLNEAKTNLAEKGVMVELCKRSNGKRAILIQKVPQSSATSAIERKAREVTEIFGGEIVDDKNNAPPIPPQPDKTLPSEKDARGDKGDVSDLPF